MKKLLLALIFLASFIGFAEAQCNGVFPNNTACGNISGSSNTPRAIPLSSFPANAPGGSTGDVQYNAGGGIFGGEPQVTTTQGGTGVNNSTNVSGEVLASNGTNGNFIHTGLASLFNSACTIGPSLCAKLTGYYSPYWYGAICNGATNDATALQNAINAAASGALFIPAATCLTSTTLTLPSNIAVAGAGRDVSIIKSTVNPAFSITNRTNVSITNIQIQGTNSAGPAWSGSPLGPIALTQNGSAVAVGSNFIIRGNKFVNWNVTYWLYVSTAGSTFPLSNLSIDDNDWISASSSVPTDADPTQNSNWFIVLYSNTGGNGRIENLSISNNRMEATGMCFGMITFANTYKYRIQNNSILNPGTTTPGHCINSLSAINAYCISPYDLNNDGNPPTSGIISGNYCLNPKASGIYLVNTNAGFNTLVTGNTIEGQSHSDVLLPRGAISLNGAAGVSIVGNFLTANTIGINIAAQVSGDVYVASNYCKSTAGSSVCLALTAGAGSTNTERKFIRSNSFEAASTSVLTTSATGQRHNVIDMSGNTIIGSSATMNFGGQFITSSGLINVADNFVAGSGTNSFSSITGSLALFGNSGLSFTAATLPATTNGSSVFVSDGAPASACTGGSTGSTGFRQNGAWKCF